MSDMLQVLERCLDEVGTPPDHDTGDDRWRVQLALALSKAVAGGLGPASGSDGHPLDTVLAAIGDGVVTFDADYSVRSFNPAAAVMLGWGPEVRGANPDGLLCPDDGSGGEDTAPDARRVNGALMRSVIGDGLSHRCIDTTFRRSDDSLIHVEYVLNPLLVSGRVSGAVMVFRDIQHRKHAEDDLKRAMRKAKRAGDQRASFLANMSHEIRTPMNAVIGMAGLLLETPLNDEQQEYAEVVRSSGQHLLELLNSILDYTKVEGGHMELERISFDLHDLLHGVLDFFVERASRSGIDLVPHIRRGVPTSLIGDPGRLRQVLINLVGNAIKFTSRGHVVVRVSVAGHRGEEPLLRFEVLDTGVGIPDDKLELLFNPFTQADASTTRRFGGTGLGLAISKEITGLMGGEIGVMSELGSGSTFWFTAQLGVDHGAAQPVHPADHFAGARVLIVDDDDDSAAALAEVLLPLGCGIDVVSEGVDALVALKTAHAAGTPYHVAFLDHHLDGLSGSDLSRAIGKHADLVDTARVLMARTGRGTSLSDADTECLSSVLHRPARPEAVVRALSVALAVPGDTLSPLPDEASTDDLRSLVPARPVGTILVAEDNEVNQILAARVLDRLGYAYEIVGTGQEAVERWQTAEFALVLMDCMMPEMDGYEATRQVREMERVFGLPHTPIIAMTADAMHDARDKCTAAGMDDYLSKPVEPGLLDRIIRSWLLRVQQHAAAQEEGTGAVAPVSVPVLAPDARARLGQMGVERREDIVELVGIFMTDANSRLAEIRSAVHECDLLVLERKAHSLKSSCAYLGAEEMKVLCFELEQAGREGELERAQDLLEAVGPTFERLVEALERAGMAAA